MAAYLCICWQDERPPPTPRVMLLYSIPVPDYVAAPTRRSQGPNEPHFLCFKKRFRTVPYVLLAASSVINLVVLVII